MTRSPSLKQWDDHVSPRLSAIANRCLWITDKSSELENIVRGIPVRPAWETVARDELNRAEIALVRALAAVRQAQAKYDALPIMIEAAE